MAKHILWENRQSISELFAVGSRRGDSGFPGEGPQLQWKTCVIQTRRKPFVQLQFPSTLVKDTYVQNDNKTKYRKHQHTSTGKHPPFLKDAFALRCLNARGRTERNDEDEEEEKAGVQ